MSWASKGNLNYPVVLACREAFTEAFDLAVENALSKFFATRGPLVPKEMQARGRMNYYVAANKKEFFWDGELAFCVQCFHDEIVTVYYKRAENGQILQ